MSMKDSNDTIGNRTRDLSPCSAVPQPNPPPRLPKSAYIILIIKCRVYFAINSILLRVFVNFLEPISQCAFKVSSNICDSDVSWSFIFTTK